MLALCEGLIQNHLRDSARYNTPTKRRAELQRLFRDIQDNVCYSCSKDAVKRLLPESAPTPDLARMALGSVRTQVRAG